MESTESWTAYNYTGLDDEEEGLCNLDPNPMEVTIQTYIHGIICAFGLIGNLLVIITYVFYKRTKTMTDVYLYNVAVADLIFVVALPFIIYNEQHSWLMGLAVCKMLRSAYSINLYSGMLLLACISGDRYFAIVQARRFFAARSRTLIYSRLICSGLWVIAVTLTVPTLIYTERYEEHNLWSVSVTVTCQMTFRTSEKAKLMKVLVPSLQMAVGFLLPLVVMVFCYSSIVYTLLRAQSTKRHKAVRVVLAVVVVFIVCQLPYNVVLLFHTLSLFKERDCEEEQFRLRVLAISRSIAYLHCCLNPILYAFIGVKFRNHFWQIMFDLWCLSKKYIYSARSSRATTEICISGSKPSEGSNHLSSFTA
ncbi:C-C chemokine receptor type 6 isoform X2 [Betta splendens]|nr:C-C chemokine receptor type 6 isoform X2 [Betta splendens]XP_055361485.1 C-C chemokine receptor type 6 isoform X2 [Betta splendens]XP_055361486.1 C-C chemokine receptor type 6 isoform X2 [Betta splendens]XP_055361487.1 C-C chemokine receptor type 6 isoform X2 [Betta splendens]